MKSLLEELSNLKDSKIRIEVDKRLKQFSDFKNKTTEEWFSELCFCILTSNSKALTAMAIQKELGPHGFLNDSEKSIRETIRSNGHRFHNKKAEYIIEARKHGDIKKFVLKLRKETDNNILSVRDKIAETIKGIGLKESGHFLRNVGYDGFSILDRHILRIMHESGLIRKTPNSLSKKIYRYIEDKYLVLAKDANMSPVELDLYLWYRQTGAVLK